MNNYILLHLYAPFDSNAIPIRNLKPYDWLFSANLGIPNGAGNVILQQLTLVGSWTIISMNACWKFAFYAQHVFYIFPYNAVVLESQLLFH